MLEGMSLAKKKRYTLWQRASFAINGILYAWRTEESFRIHCAICALELLLVALLNAPVHWILSQLICVGAVLSFELANTALENTLDHLAPNKDPAIKAAKDCAAGAVLLMSLVSAAVTLTYIIIYWSAN